MIYLLHTHVRACACVCFQTYVDIICALCSYFTQNNFQSRYEDILSTSTQLGGLFLNSCLLQYSGNIWHCVGRVDVHNEVIIMWPKLKVEMFFYFFIIIKEGRKEETKKERKNEGNPR